MNDDVLNQYKSESKFRTLFLIFSSISLIIACLGLFGLATAATQQRQKEVSIRKILGSSVLKILKLLSGDFLRLIAVAMIIAIPVAWFGMDEWLKGFAYRIDLDVSFFVISGLLALIISLLTVSYQSLKTALSNPVNSLRNE